MRFRSCFLAAMVLAGSMTPSLAGGPLRYDVKIRVPLKDPAGKNWDLALGPDIEICVKADGSFYCDNGEGIFRSKTDWKNASSCLNVRNGACEMRYLRLPAGDFDVRIVDRDMFSSELMAEGSCNVERGFCLLGNGDAQLSFRKSPSIP